MKTRLFKQYQRGLSLPFALIALVGLGLAGVSMMRATDATTLIAGNLGFRETAAKATDLGLEAGIAGLTAMTATRESDQAASNYFASLESVNLAPTTARLSASLPTTNIPPDTPTGNTVRYVVERMCRAAGAASAANCVMDAAGGAMYRVTAMTIGPRNASQTTQLMFSLNVPVAPCAMMFQGRFVVSGVRTQNGSSTCLHSNTSVTVSGTPATSGIVVSAVGAVGIGGGGGLVESTNKNVRTLPAVSPAGHRDWATHIFTAGGTPLTTHISGATAVSTGSSGDWEWQPGANPPQWKLNVDKDGTCPPPGRYYFESNVEIPKKIGSTALTCELSIISTGCLKINGLVFLKNYRGAVPTGTPAATNNVFLMAGGGDLELPGSSRFFDGTVRTAVISARSELKANGDLIMDAALLARNELATTPCNLVDENIIPGNVTQNYTGGGGGGGGGGATTATRKSWRFATR